MPPRGRSALASLYGRGRLGPGDLEFACVEFLELLGPAGKFHVVLLSGTRLLHLLYVFSAF